MTTEENASGTEQPVDAQPGVDYTKCYFKDYLDVDHNPAGGSAEGLGFNITWQNGPIKIDGRQVAPNGAYPSTILKVVQHRLEFHQKTRFKCEENEQALDHLMKAIAWLEARATRRQAQGILGTHEPDRPTLLTTE